MRFVPSVNVVNLSAALPHPVQLLFRAAIQAKSRRIDVVDGGGSAAKRRLERGTACTLTTSGLTHLHNLPCKHTGLQTLHWAVRSVQVGTFAPQAGSRICFERQLGW